MRYALAPVLALVLAHAAPAAAAWEFTPHPVCTLQYEGEAARVTVTRDPGRPEPYAIELTRTTPWPAGPVFALRFEGGRTLTISTMRHSLSRDGHTLTVTDHGFGNVLDGLEFNTAATALVGTASVPISLAGAAEPVRAFRDCPAAPAV